MSQDVPNTLRVIQEDELGDLLASFCRVLYEAGEDKDLPGLIYNIGHVPIHCEYFIAENKHEIASDYLTELDPNFSGGDLNDIFRSGQELIKYGHEQINEIGLMLDNIKELAATSSEFDIESASRLCSIEGCTNTIPVTAHYATKYCTECQATGAVKRLHNKRHSDKIKHLRGE